MKSNMLAMLFAVESSKGDFEGVVYDSTTFHVTVDLGKKSNGKTIGLVTRPFKLGDSTEIDKWAGVAPHLNAGKGVPVECEFDIVAARDGVKLSLLAIKPATQAKAL